MSAKIYGYIRVSTREQNEDRQLIAMEELSVPAKNLFIDKQSSEDFQRPQYQKMVKQLKPDDLLYIKSIDRLGRNYEEILEQWRILTKDKRIDIVVLSFVAENERINIRQRQAEGIAAAKARGVHCGRRRLAIPDGFEDMAARWADGGVSATIAATELGMSRDTFLRRAREFYTISSS